MRKGPAVLRWESSRAFFCLPEAERRLKGNAHVTEILITLLMRSKSVLRVDEYLTPRHGRQSWYGMDISTISLQMQEEKERKFRTGERTEFGDYSQKKIK